MERYLKSFLSILFLFVVITSCKEDEQPLPTKDVGYLSLRIALQIDELPAGRLNEVNTDDFIVTIHNASDDSEYVRFEPFSDAPAEIELPTGEYYVIATNLEDPELQAAAFDQPWHWGQSEVFNIDKEEVKTIDVTTTIRNCLVSFTYSPTVYTDFHTVAASVTLVNEAITLDYDWQDEGDPGQEGYFFTNPLSILIHLEYQKQFSNDIITRDFVASIDPPLPATHYRVNVDAALEDGRVNINLTVDDGITIIDIVPILLLPFSGPGDNTEVPGGATWTPSGDIMAVGTAIWDFTDVVHADNNRVYWGPLEDEVKSSMNGNTFDAGEIMDFDPNLSDLPNGVLVFTGTTNLLPPDETQVFTKFEMTILDNVTQTPIALIDPTFVGMPETMGGLVEFTSGLQQVEVRFTLIASGNNIDFLPFLDYFDAHERPNNGGQAVSSFTGGFFWD